MDVIIEAKNRFSNISDLVNKLLSQYLSSESSKTEQDEQKIHKQMLELDAVKTKLERELLIIADKKKKEEDKAKDVARNRRILELEGTFTNEDN